MTRGFYCHGEDLNGIRGSHPKSAIQLVKMRYHTFLEEEILQGPDLVPLNIAYIF